MKNYAFKSVKLYLDFIFIAFSMFSLTCNTNSNLKNYPEETYEAHFFRPTNTLPPNQILYRPSILRINSTGKVLVLDNGNNRVVEYSPEGLFLKQFGSIGQGPGDILNPIYIDLDYKDNLYVLELGNKRISIFDSSGIFVNSFKITKMPAPFSICVVSPNRILVNQPTINGPLFYVYNAKGDLIDSLGTVKNYSNSSFKGPNEIATKMRNSVNARFDKKDRIFVAYVCEPVLKCFSKNGKLLFDKKIEGNEIDSLEAKEDQLNKENTEPPNPNMVRVVKYIDDIELNNDDLIIELSGHLYNKGGRKGKYFYLLNKMGIISAKYFLEPSFQLGNYNPSIRNFDITQKKIFGCDTYNGELVIAFPTNNITKIKKEDL